MKSITHKGAQGVNYVSENLPPNISPYSLNVDTEGGIWKKRKGKYAIIDTLGASPIHSMHTGKTSTGDALLACYDTSLYSLTGTAETIIKTTTADFTAGTLSGAKALSDAVVIGTLEEDFETLVNATHGVIPTGWTDGMDSFTTGYANTTWKTESTQSFRLVQLASEFARWTGYVSKLFDLTDVDRIILDYKLINTSISTGTQLKIFIDSDVVLSKIGIVDETVEDYAIDVSTYTGNHTFKIYQETTDVYSSDFSIDNLRFKKLEGTYISQTLDLAQTPSACTLDYNDTKSGSQTVFMYVSSSEDSTTWSDYTLASNGGNLPYKRYLKIKAILTSDSYYTTPSLDDYTVSYTTNADTTTEIVDDLSGEIVRFMNYDGRTYFVDGDYPRYWDGTNTKTLGVNVSPNGSDATLTTGATGLLSGVYSYRFTYVDVDGTEGNPGDISADSASVTNKKIELTDIPTSTGMNRRIYRTIEGGTVYYLVDEITDDTTTVYSDNLADSVLQDATKILQIDNFPPPKSTLIYEHKNYYFYVDATDKSILWFSKVYGTSQEHPLGAFEQVPLTNYKKLPNDITAIVTYENKLVISGEGFTGFYTGSIWGGDSDNTSWYPVDSIGALNQEGVALCQTLSGAICVIFTGGGIRYLIPGEYETALQRLPLSKDIQPYVDDWVTTESGMIFHNSKLYVSFIYYEDTPVTYQNVMFAYDFKRNMWDGPWDFKLSAAAVYNRKVYAGDSRSGLVYEMFTGSDDAGENIHMICDLVADTHQYNVMIQRLKVHATTDSTTDDLYIKMDIDGKNKIMPTGAKSTWRQTATNYSQDLMEKRLSVKKRGSFYNLRIEDDSTNPIEIKSIIVEYEGVKE